MSGSSVFLANLDGDFIAPSQGCVNPLFAAPAAAAPAAPAAAPGAPAGPPPATGNASARGAAKVSVASGIFSGLDAAAAALSGPVATTTTSAAGATSKTPGLIRDSGRKTARVTLNDCLACSGCVTSAETVLIESQSASTLRAALAEARTPEGTAAAASPSPAPPPHHRVVLSLSPQSRASLAARFGLTLRRTQLALAAYFKRLGVALVISTSAGNDIALVEARAEFLTRYRRRRAPAWERPPDSVADSATGRHCPHTGGALPVPRLAATKAVGGAAADAGANTAADGYTLLPMLASNCPGFVCFVEKTHPETLPYLSTCRSAQQITGRLVKGAGGLLQQEEQPSRPPAEATPADVAPPSPRHGAILHVTVMPCFDKKLEASRKDFQQPAGAAGPLVRDVDLVVSTAEVLEMLEEDGVDLGALAPLAAPAQGTVEGDLQGFALTRADGGVGGGGGGGAAAAAGDGGTGGDSLSYGSGGFLEHVFRHASRELFGIVVEGPLRYVATRNPDLQYVELKDADTGRPLLRFARAYGFRSIQAVVRQLRRRKCKYDYIEIMACPSGCLNGGGQLRGENVTATRAQLAATKTAFHGGPAGLRDPGNNPVCAAVYEGWLGGCPPMGPAALRELHTQFHAVPKMELVAPERIKW